MYDVEVIVGKNCNNKDKNCLLSEIDILKLAQIQCIMHEFSNIVLLTNGY